MSVREPARPRLSVVGAADRKAGFSAASVRQDTMLRRAVDIAVAAAALAVMAVPLLVLAYAVRLETPGPAFFRQTRVGRGQRPFRIWKLRSMRVGAETMGPAVSGDRDPRCSALGLFLRRSRLDELPQLINLLTGDVTLVGPRPEVPKFLPFYSDQERRLLSVRPGIIGPGAILFAKSQAQQLDEVADPEDHYVRSLMHPRLALDLEYLTRRSLVRDIGLVATAIRLCLT
jgi:lipopolysaccharide/colanic/teichoic acid biosynthesis glycosyltransferase